MIIVPDIIRPFVRDRSDTKKHSIAAIKDGLQEDGVVIYFGDVSCCDEVWSEIGKMKNIISRSGIAGKCSRRKGAEEMEVNIITQTQDPDSK